MSSMCLKVLRRRSEAALLSAYALAGLGGPAKPTYPTLTYSGTAP